MPISRLLSLFIVCIALPGWLISLLHKRRDGDGHEDPDQLGKNDEKAGLATDVEKAMEELRLYSFEREVLSSALTTIYEAEVKGILKVSERDRLAASYKEDLRLLDEKIDERRRIADLINLEKEKRELQTYYSEKTAEIDKKIEELKALIGSLPQPDSRPATPNQNLTEGMIHLNEKNNSPSTQTVETVHKTRTKAEEKMDAIREEVLRAIERLEQMESEG